MHDAEMGYALTGIAGGLKGFCAEVSVKTQVGSLLFDGVNILAFTIADCLDRVNTNRVNA